MRYMQAAAEALHAPRRLHRGVLAAAVSVPGGRAMTRWLALSAAVDRRAARHVAAAEPSVSPGTSCWAASRSRGLARWLRSRRRRHGLGGWPSVPGLLRDGRGRHRAVEHRRGPDHLRPGRAGAPLRLRARPARPAQSLRLAALACIVTATPGTVWVEYDSSESTMLLPRARPGRRGRLGPHHQGRYERRLMEIFE